MRKTSILLLLVPAVLITGCGGGGGGGSAPSSAVTGTVVDGTGTPVAGVTIEVSGVTFQVPPVTDLTGAFSVNVPQGLRTFGFDPGGSVLAPAQVKDQSVTGALNLGTITLQQGFPLGGMVTTTTGAPVVTGDINVYDDATGVKLYTPGDNTDATGTFDVTVPPGTYRVRARPPAGQTLVAQEITGVIVGGPTLTPTLVLPQGVLLSGTVTATATGQALMDVDVTVIDEATDIEIITPNNTTAGNGSFSVVVPTGTFRVEFAAPLTALVVGKRVSGVVVAGSSSMGVTTLDPGFLLTGTVLGPGGAPVTDTDTDVISVPGGVAVFTPGDNTDALGRFQVVVPAGDYFVRVEPRFTSSLVGAKTGTITVGAPMTLPTFNLITGVVLSGTISAPGGGPEVNADLDVIDPSTGAILVTPGDNTDSNGQYAIIVPGGTWDIAIQPDLTSTSLPATIPGVVVSGPTTFNHQL